VRRYEAGALQLELEEPVPFWLHCVVFVTVSVVGPVLWAWSYLAYHLRGGE